MGQTCPSVRAAGGRHRGGGKCRAVLGSLLLVQAEPRCLVRMAGDGSSKADHHRNA